MDENLPAALDKLHTAVALLVDDRKEFHGGRMLVRPSLYSDLVDAVIPRSASEASRSPSSSKMLVWAEPMELVWEIDAAAKGWWLDGATTPDRLRSFVSGRFRPQDSRRLTDIAEQITAWCKTIEYMLDPPAVKTFSAPCPDCGFTHVRKHVAGEWVRVPALQLTVGVGCQCLNRECGAFWPPSAFTLWASIIGCERPEGVTV